MNNLQELKYTNWKVYIDNTSIWFDEINKKIAKCYTQIDLIKHIFPEIRAFSDSRSAQLKNFSEINKILEQIESIIYSNKYKELNDVGEAGDWNSKILRNFSKIIRLLSYGLSSSDLTPQFKQAYDPSKAVQTME